MLGFLPKVVTSGLHQKRTSLMSNITLFSQIIQKIDRPIFKKLVKQMQTDKGCEGFDSWTHLLSMLFCYFAKSTSVRDIFNGLRSATGNLNHLGIVRAPSKSSISYQNQRRDAYLLKKPVLCAFGQFRTAGIPKTR